MSDEELLRELGWKYHEQMQRERAKLDAECDATLNRHLSGELVEYKGIFGAMSDTTNDPQKEWFRKRRETHPNEDIADRIEAFASTTNDEQGRWIILGSSVDGKFTPDQEAIYAGVKFEKVKAATAPLLSDEVLAMVARHASSGDALIAGIAIAEEMQRRKNKSEEWLMRDGHATYKKLYDEYRAYEKAIDAKIASGELITSEQLPVRVARGRDGLLYRNHWIKPSPVEGFHDVITKEEFDRLVSEGAKITEG